MRLSVCRKRVRRRLRKLSFETVILVLVCIGIGSFVWLAKRETVPYTLRRRTIVVPYELEERIGIEAFNQVTAAP